MENILFAAEGTRARAQAKKEGCSPARLKGWAIFFWANEKKSYELFASE